MSAACIDIITRGHFLYWDMLGNLDGNRSHNEGNLRWLTGHVNFNYFANSVQFDEIIKRMKNGDIPHNLMFFPNEHSADPSGLFIESGMFKKDFEAIGMAKLLTDDKPLPETDKHFNLFRVSEISQLKAAGAILNTVFDYRIFSFEHFMKMYENEGQFFYLAEYNGLPVGAVMSQNGDFFINSSWVGTLPGYRNLGIAGSLIKMAERDGVSRGKTMGVLSGYPEAVGAYRNVGYKEYNRKLGVTFINPEENS
jgi:ribosomal protein S18 acetylase RimI-like enzyme